MCALLGTGHAQNITGSTTIDIDPNSGVVTATCETDLDTDSEGFYNAGVVCRVVDSNNKLVASGGASDTDELGYAMVTLTFNGTPGLAYTATGTHRAYMLYQQDFTEPPAPFQPGYYYDDYYDFQSFESEGGDLYTNSYTWEGPGPETPEKPVVVSIGNTTAKTPPAATITMKFSGSKSAGDSLLYSNSNGTCSETLGPMACPTAFRFSYEGKVVVSDQASNWTVSQTLVSGRTKAVYKSDPRGTYRICLRPMDHLQLLLKRLMDSLCSGLILPPLASTWMIQWSHLRL